MKTKLQPVILIIALLCELIIGTENCKGQNNIDSIYFIKHGIIFGTGMCSGYCFHETKFDNSLIISCSKIKEHQDEAPEKFDTLKINQSYWQSLIKSINIDTFYKLSETTLWYGCSAGSEEWIELGTGSKTYKVDFAYGENIEGLTKLLELLRKTY